MERKEASVQVAKIVAGQFGEAALLTQDHISIYPGARANSSLQDNVFNDSQFGEDRVYTTVRYALIKVPVGSTVESVNNAIKAATEAGKSLRVYRIISNDVNDLLTDEQKMMMASGRSQKTIEDYQNQYEVQDKDGVRYKDSFGQRQYRRHLFTTSGKADIDLRKKLATVPIAEAVTAEAVQEPAPDMSRHQELINS